MVWRYVVTKCHERSISTIRLNGGIPRKDKFFPKSPSCEHKNTTEALCVGSSNTPLWATETAGRKPAYKAVPERDEVSWNALILQHSKSGQGRQALRIYEAMLDRGVKASSYTFVAALKACSSLQDLERGKQIHADAVKNGFALDVFVGTMLVDFYVKCGSLDDARHAFEKICRNVVSWNAMIMGYAQMEEGEEALQLYTRMQQEGVVPNDRTFVAALKACSVLASLEEGDATGGTDVKRHCLEQVRAIHSDVMQSRYESDIFVESLLVDVYAKCGSLVDARHVFEKMPHRNVVSWTAMILGYAQVDKGEIALQLYARMQQEGVVPNDRTFIGALKACSSLVTLEDGSEGDGQNVMKRSLQHVRAIHSDVVKGGFELATFLGSMLVDVYVKCKSVVDARRVFDKIPHRDVASWNTMILGYAQLEDGEEALKLYKRMQQEGVMPDGRTFLGALKACSSLAALDDRCIQDGTRVKQRSLKQAQAIHADILKSGSEPDVFVGTMLVDVYAKCGRLMDARCVFERMPRHNVISWTAMILGYAQLEDGDEALQLYARMQQEGVVPNELTYIAALKACGIVAGLGKGKEIHAEVSKTGIEGVDVCVLNALIEMYARCGSIGDAQQVFDSLSFRETATWNALMAGYARQGDTDRSFDCFQRMILEGIQPDGITFLSVLNVCSHVGLVDKGELYFDSMRQDFDITPTVEHFSCMVDLLCRAGQFDRAMSMIVGMPFQPPIEVWRCMLGACQKWGNVELGRQAFESAVRLDKTDSAAYVLMSNIYAAAHMQEHAKDVKTMRVKARAWKQPGQTWCTDIKGTVHTFLVGDQGRPESQDMYAKLQKIFAEMMKR